MVITIPLVLFGLFRYWFIVETMDGGDTADNYAVLVEDDAVDCIEGKFVYFELAAAEVDHAGPGADVPGVHLLHQVQGVLRAELRGPPARAPDAEGYEAVGVDLGEYLTSYFKAQGLIVEKDGAWVDQYWSLFQMAKHDPHRALPEEWWEFAVGFWSMAQERTVPPVEIPSGTALFTLKIRILEGTAPGEYDVTCEDEHYWTHSRTRRRDFMFTAGRDSQFARGGITKVETIGGKITVLA